jgi:hypothetical protein
MVTRGQGWKRDDKIQAKKLKNYYFICCKGLLQFYASTRL